ncbi:MAG TPA: class I tRNA ligase family protein, partial [Thermoplasmata archaeon]|nr:class I tRNA ligase family protein [Thermoplasmata archaeon]
DRHKYTRLPIDAADSFILRDLTEGGLVFAQLTVRRGVPYCSICGRGLLWLPGRAWCLEMTRLPPSIQRQFSQLLPNDPLPTGTEIVPWPFSHFPVSEDRLDPQLLECGSCDRVFPMGAPPVCVCGSPLAPVRRSLLAAPLEALLAWSTGQPGESAHLFVSDRRRAPAVLHHLIARESAGARGNEVRLVLLPTMPPAELTPLTAPDASKDALRAALIGLSILERGPSSVVDRCRQEARRLRKFWELSRSLIDGMIREGIPFDDEPISTRVQGLPEEDRAFLSRFERLRIDVRSLYEAQQLAQAQDRLVRFMEEELRGGYLPMVRFRLEPTASPAARAATYQLLARVLTEWAELSAPIVPFTMEAVTRGFLEDERSVFERGFTPTNETLLDATREAEYDRWVSFAEALQRARREVGLPVDAILPKVVLLVADDRLGAELSRSSGVLERLGRVGRIDVDSPQHPWAGRRIEARPVSSEIQKAYGAQAPRILRLLEHMPGRKILDGIQAGSLTLALEGQTVSILPSMVELMESLPECVVPIPWQDGEILLVDPTEKTGGQLPSLSLDGFGIVRHIQRRLRRAHLTSPPLRVLVAASGILSEEVAHHASAIAKHIGIPRVEIAEDAASFPPLERSFGRTRRGDRWSVWILGVQVEPGRPKRRASPTARSRVRPLTESADR